MALTGDTGNGATLSFAGNMGFGTATTSVEAISISQGEESVGVIDVSTLATTDAMESIPSDLREIAESSVNYKFITTVDAVDLPAAAGTITITYPIRSGETAAATYIGTGFITGFSPPSLANGELQAGELKWKWDGDTGPAFTKAT